MNAVRFTSGEQGKRFAEILGIEAWRLSKNASIEIHADSFAVACVEIRLTPEELKQLTQMLTEGP